VLIKLGADKEQWQLDLMKTSQRAILARTKGASPRRYAAAKRANAGNGTAYPEGFTVDVTTDHEIAFPFHVGVDLTANPKEFPDFPANLDSHLNAIVTADGKFIVKDFHLASPKKSMSDEAQNILGPDDQDSEECYYSPHNKP
jgi:hypothetical protein